MNTHQNRYRGNRLADCNVVALPVNLLTSPGTLAEDLEDYANWSATVGSIADNTTTPFTGTHCISGTTGSGTTTQFQKTVSYNISSFGRGMFAYRSTVALGDNPRIYFASAADFATYALYKSVYTPIPGLGWNTIHFADNTLSNYGTDLASIIRIRFRGDAASGTPTFDFDSLYLYMQGVPAIYFQFEDARMEHYDAAVYMARAGMRGSFSIVSDLIGSQLRLTWAQLRSMESMGHCIINATKDHANLGGQSQANQQLEFTNCRDAGIANGIWAGNRKDDWRYMSYPNGSYDSNSLLAFDAEGMLLGFNTSGANTMHGFPLGQRYMLPFTHLSPSKSLADCTALIDTTIAGGFLFLCYLETFGGLSISYDIFKGVIDYLETKRGKIHTITAADMYAATTSSVKVPRPKAPVIEKPPATIGSFDFNGTTNRIDWASPWNPGGAAITISAWINVDALAHTTYVCQMHQAGDAVFGTVLNITTAGRVSFIRNGATDMIREAVATITTGRWWHVLVTHDGVITTAASVHCYSNGVEASSYTTTTNGATEDSPSGSWSIGGRIYDDARNLDGHICQVAVWNRVLTADEITALSQGQYPQAFPSDLKFYWKGNTDSLVAEVGGTGTADGAAYVASDGPTIIYS